ncbi:hypothetical protein KQX54_000789 [Cotesia glomerata]|uniref:Uncharacterized protein n=1 Tax=Cotesia glomerata TaxID=32391 RepID=A0AAV7IJ19_COTGL|nr:hypothetical protein KQX54_000789 [Cotesia glomerata]
MSTLDALSDSPLPSTTDTSEDHVSQIFLGRLHCTTTITTTTTTYPTSRQPVTGTPSFITGPQMSDQSRQTSVSSVEIQHFGLPILSVSEASPPDEKNNRLDDYL